MPLLVLAACSTPLRFSPSALPPGKVGAAFLARVEVQRRSTPIFRAGLERGQLPPGLTLAHDDGGFTLAGTPTQAGEYRLTVSVGCYGTSFAG